MGEWLERDAVMVIVGGDGAVAFRDRECRGGNIYFLSYPCSYWVGGTKWILSINLVN